MNNKNWHQKHRENFSFGNKLADSVAHGMGSWKFIIIQTLIVLNLVFSTQAAYAAPIIMMSQNRQNERDREQAQSDYQTNIDEKLEIEALTKKLELIEIYKLDKIIQLLEEQQQDSKK